MHSPISRPQTADRRGTYQRVRGPASPVSYKKSELIRGVMLSLPASQLNDAH